MQHKRNINGFSLLETMTVIAVIAIVLGLLYSYSDQGWKLFYQSYSRGLSQTKAKLAARIIVEDIREANKKRLIVTMNSSIGIPTPDDTSENSTFLYFTKPVFYKSSSEVTGYDYNLYYFAKPKKINEPYTRTARNNNNDFLVLKSIKFLNQSKIYTEDPTMIWPFLPPLLEIQKSRLPEDEELISELEEENLKIEQRKKEEENTENKNVFEQPKLQEQAMNEEEIFLDHFSLLKRESKNIPISGNFLASNLTDPISLEEDNIFFGQGDGSTKTIKIKFIISESPVLFGLMNATSEYEVKVSPRN